MEQLLKLIVEIGKIRKKPQFLFYENIDMTSLLRLRTAIIEFKNEKKNNDISEIDFILNSPGGSADDAYRVIRTLRGNFDVVNIVVPFWAKSAATLLAIGGSTIIMDDFGEFGPLDAQLPKPKDDSPDYDRVSALVDELSLKQVEYRAQRLFKLMFIDFYENKSIPINKNELSSQLMNYLSKFYEPLLKQINPYNFGEKKMSLDTATKYANRILIHYNDIDDNLRNLLVDFLVNDCPDHGYVIDYHIISKFLNNVILSSDLGIDFENKLRQISNYFVRVEHEENYVGFVEVEDELNKEKSTKEKLSEEEAKKENFLESNIIVNGNSTTNSKTIGEQL